MRITEKALESGYMPKWYYGLSYRKYSAKLTVWHIIPVNYIIRFFRFFRDKLRSKPK